jgi:NitT/TauT family transport system permease protein
VSEANGPSATWRFARSAGAARLGSVVLLLLVWWLVSAIAESRYLPDPLTVLNFIIREAASGELGYHLAVTLARVAAAFIAAMAIGSALGLAMGRSSALNVVVEPWIILLLNTPALIMIVLAYIWIGLNETAAILAVALNKIPNVVVTVREGARAMDPAIMEMARVYRFSRRSVLRDVMLPQLQPYLAASARSGLALIWKIVLVVELLGRSNGVGFQISLYFQTFDVRAILGYTVVFVIVMLLIEFLAVQPIEKRAYRWRPRPA